MRGTVDQQPIILEVGQATPNRQQQGQAGYSDGDSNSLKTKSSDDSLEPHTPNESATYNQDRRYIYIPEEGIEIPLSYDEPKPLPAASIGQRRAASRDGRSERRLPKLDFSSKEENPLNTKRQPSPYSYASSSGKSGLSAEFHLSPQTLSPEARFSESPRTTLKSPNDGGSPRHLDKRTSGFASVRNDRPTINRHSSATLYPGEPLSAGVLRSPKLNPTYSSDDSDSSSDDSEHARARDKRSRRQSFVRPELSRQTSALRYDEAVQQSRKATNPGPQANSPSFRPLNASNDRVSRQDLYYKGLPIPPTDLYMASKKAQALPIRMSPHPSPTTSPYSSPPRSPQLGTRRDGYESPPVGRRSRPTSRPSSRPSSPLSFAKHSIKAPGLELPLDTLPGVYGSKPSPRSRHTSPLPSPISNRNGYKSEPRNDLQAAFPASGHRPMTQAVDPALRPRSRESSVPFVLAQPPLSRPGIDNQRRALSTADARMKPSTEDHPRRSSEWPSTPSTKEPPRASTPNPSSIQQPDLPSCPRPNYVAGYNDWHTLVGCPTFDICPTCLEAVRDTGHGANFVPSPPRPYGYETRCDFSIPWIRMAWLLTLKKGIPHVKLLYTMADILAREPPCTGKVGAVRPWFRLYDPDTRKTISNFDVCPCCVRSLETIFPSLRGVFQPAQLSNPSQLRTCDLRGDSKRFAAYVDLLEEIANQADQYRRPPNMLRFLQLVKKMSAIRECTRDDMIIGQPWHFMPQIPEFTICEECYDEVVWPAIRDGSPLASQFNRTLQTIPPSNRGASCQLYSPRMREIFRDACRRNDFHYLRGAVMQRYMVEWDLQAKRVQASMYGYDQKNDGVARLKEEWKRWE